MDMPTMPKPEPSIQQIAMGDTQKDIGDQGTATLPLAKFTELRGAEQGSKVTGSWEGEVESVDQENAVIKFTRVDLSTTNSADREMERMMGKPKIKPATNEPVDRDDE